MTFQYKFLEHLTSIRQSLERLAPKPIESHNFSNATAFLWHGDSLTFTDITHVRAVPLTLLKGIEPQKQTLLDNSTRFAEGYPANNALLWGARGMGKSSLVKAVHASLQNDYALTGKTSAAKMTASCPKLVEIQREDIESLPTCLSILKKSADKFILYCDDLSFDDADTSYKSLKAILEGGLEGKPENVIFYATSNRRHLMPRDMIENESSTAIHPSESVEEKVSLSDRFGLWIGFHNCSQQDYLDMIEGYVQHFGLDTENIKADAIEWSATRGARSGRVGWQFIQDRAGRQKKRLPL